MTQDSSVLQYLGKSNSACLYCNAPSTCVKLHALAQGLSPEAYEALVFGGWRRSGTLLYKFILPETCCPAYATRMPIKEFRLHRSHRKILHRLMNFLKTGVCPDKNTSYFDAGLETVSKKPVNYNAQISTNKAFSNCLSINQNPSKAKYKRYMASRHKKLQKMSENEVDEYFLIRKKNRIKKHKPKTIHELLKFSGKDWKHEMHFKFLKGDRETSNEMIESEYKLYKKYLSAVHKISDYTLSSFIEEMFTTFLESSSKDGNYDRPCKGSFHLQYWIDDTLVAVSVLDILNTSISSAFFFYDPDYKFLQLGFYSVLREIQLCFDYAHSHIPTIEYYCLGYYVPSCKNSVYKAQVPPTYLLCPINLTWHKLELVKTKLDESLYSILGENKEQKNVDISRLKILLNKEVCYFFTLLQCNKNVIVNEIQELANNLGSEAVEYITVLLNNNE